MPKAQGHSLYIAFEASLDNRTNGAVEGYLLMRGCKICHTCKAEDSFLEKMALKLKAQGSAGPYQVTGRKIPEKKKKTERAPKEKGLVLANASA